MFKDKLQNFLIKKENEPNKKKIENLVVFVILLIITIIVINVIWNGEDNKNDEVKTDSNKKLAQTTESETINGKLEEENKDSLISDLEDILSKINGVGEVKVMITYSETSKIMPVYNEDSSEETTEEEDAQGGTRKVTQTDNKKEVIYEEKDGEKILITQSVVSPKIEGAIITAKGANNSVVKTNIIQAVEAVTGLATHKIQVFEMSD